MEYITLPDFFDIFGQDHRKQQIVSALGTLPSNYVGSKRRILPHIWETIDKYNIEFDSVFDAFSGSAMVSLLFKMMDKQVICNDLLTSSAITAICLLENSDIPLTPEDIHFLVTNNPKDKGTFVIDNYKDKFFTEKDLLTWAEKMKAHPGDLLLILSGDAEKTLKQLNVLRLHMGDLLQLKDPFNYKPLWVVDFPLLEWDENTRRFHAMHHPFTSPKTEDINLLETNPGAVRANAYDFVINGVEIGGGSIRIHDRELQKLMFRHLGFSDEQAQDQFGFLMNAFEYGAPPHGGIAFGFDRLAALFGGQDSIRDFIAFPKNNAGRDMMIDSPSIIANEQLDELGLIVKKA